MVLLCIGGGLEKTVREAKVRMKRQMALRLRMIVALVCTAVGIPGLSISILEPFIAVVGHFRGGWGGTPVDASKQPSIYITCLFRVC